MTETGPWPALPYEDWEPTKQNLHRYTQIVGKIRMALVPFRNHWWHVTLLPDVRGLTTGPMPIDGGELEIRFDLLDHRLVVSTSDGRERLVELGGRPACADFYSDVFHALKDLGINVEILPLPYDLGDSPAFPEDREHDSYDRDAVTRFWQTLMATDRVLRRFSSRFNGKSSPIQLFWHSFDLAYGRYSGRPAPVTAGVDPVTAEAYSHEVSAFGYWPGDDRRTPFPAFYSYIAPEPDGLRDRPLPEGAEWQDTGNGSLAILPYEQARTATDPERLVLDFYEAAWQAGAGLAGWDLEALATGHGD